jgi:hypothetical protein
MSTRCRLLVGAISLIVASCSESGGSGGKRQNQGGDVDGGEQGGSGGSGGSGGQQALIVGGRGAPCVPKTCAELGYACGEFRSCDLTISCADEGRTCGEGEICVGGLNGEPTECLTAGEDCDVCGSIPDCSDESQPTRLTGRVITAGRTDGDSPNQIGVPNAIVYIMRTTELGDLPDIAQGIPAGGTSCDRCEEQDLGPVLLGAVTDATGSFELEGDIPVDKEFLLVVKAGKFRRAVEYTVPEEARCQTTELPTTLPGNPTRLPRSSSDGLVAHLPRMAISTGRIDAMECVFEKMGIAHGEFGNPGAGGSESARIHLYRGGGDSGNPEGAHIAGNQTPFDSALYGNLARLQSYDMVVSDCEGAAWDENFTERDASGANVREYVNRGGRMFASHLSFSWLHANGTQAYDEDNPIATGLGPAGTWELNFSQTYPVVTGTLDVSIGSDEASPRIDNFADWLVKEGISSGAPAHEIMGILEPRSQNLSLGSASEEFLNTVSAQNANMQNMPAMAGRVQQFSFNTPYAAPEEAACGRVAYSGFHVSAGGSNDAYQNATFPDHCTSNNGGALTKQEKVLLYMLFDLGACVGTQPVAPSCVPLECGDQCGYPADGCGNVLDCGLCPIN